MTSYIKDAVRTESTYEKLSGMLVCPEKIPRCLNGRLLHGAIGLCTEVGELFDAIQKPGFAEHVKEEIGDLWWYNAILHDTMHSEMLYSLSDGVGFSATVYLERIAAAVGNIQDVIKRTLFYGKSIDTMRLLEQMDVLTVNLCLFGYAVGVTPEQAQAANIAKLKARYPAKFTEENAVNRDIEAERIALK